MTGRGVAVAGAEPRQDVAEQDGEVRGAQEGPGEVANPLGRQPQAKVDVMLTGQEDEA